MMEVEIIRITQGPLAAMADAASRCYDSEPSPAIVDHCYRSGHHSIMEFATIHFRIRGVSRALTHQLVRHRIGCSYAQRSQRYVVEDGFNYVIPDSIAKDELAAKEYESLILTIRHFYKWLIDRGIPAEDARYILPNACCTEIDVQFTFRAFMHFCNERLCQRAQWEIRELARKMRDEVVRLYPELAPYLVPRCERYAPHCFCPEQRGCGRYPTLAQLIERGSENGTA